jgi:hypothetical protein
MTKKKKELLGSSQKEQYYRRLYDVEVPPERRAPSALVALGSDQNHNRWKHKRGESSEGVSGPHE